VVKPEPQDWTARRARQASREWPARLVSLVNPEPPDLPVLVDPPATWA